MTTHENKRDRWGWLLRSLEGTKHERYGAMSFNVTVPSTENSPVWVKGSFDHLHADDGSSIVAKFPVPEGYADMEGYAKDRFAETISEAFRTVEVSSGCP